jgi:hypothetical protein
MKRMIFIGIFAALILGTVFAQGNSSQGRTQPEKVSLSGTLGISRGIITLESGGIVYFTRGLDRFVGFIDGLKAGASASLEGYATSRDKEAKEKFLRVTKLSIGGKDYDIAPSLAEGGQVQFSYWRRGDEGLRHMSPRQGPQTMGRQGCAGNRGFDRPGVGPGSNRGPGPDRSPGPRGQGSGNGRGGQRPGNDQGGQEPENRPRGQEPGNTRRPVPQNPR